MTLIHLHVNVLILDAQMSNSDYNTNIICLDVRETIENFSRISESTLNTHFCHLQLLVIMDWRSDYQEHLLD